MIVWFTGQPGSGKSTLAAAVAATVTGLTPVIVDGDDLRQVLANPGYDRAGRERNVDRAQAIAGFLDGLGFLVLVAVVASYRAQRESFRRAAGVLEVYLYTHEERGKEAYHVAEYEAPGEGGIAIDTGRASIETAAGLVHRALAAVS